MCNICQFKREKNYKIFYKNSKPDLKVEKARFSIYLGAIALFIFFKKHTFFTFFSQILIDFFVFFNFLSKKLLKK